MLWLYFCKHGIPAIRDLLVEVVVNCKPHQGVVKYRIGFIFIYLFIFITQFIFCGLVKVGRSGSRTRDQNGGRRPGRAHVNPRPWPALPASQLLPGNQGKRVRNPQGTAGCCKECIVTYFVVAHTQRNKRQCDQENKALTMQMFFSVLNVVVSLSPAHLRN